MAGKVGLYTLGDAGRGLGKEQRLVGQHLGGNAVVVIEGVLGRKEDAEFHPAEGPQLQLRGAEIGTRDTNLIRGQSGSRE